MIGAPVQDYADWTKSFVHFRNFPKIAKQISDLEKQVKELKEKIG